LQNWILSNASLQYQNRRIVSIAHPAVLALATLSFLAGPSLAANDVKTEWLTWSFFRITTPGGKAILTNPWYANRDSTITLDDIPAADIILVPAGHVDEAGNTLEIAARTGATNIASHEVIKQLWKEPVPVFAPRSSVKA
jgi:hypothetical protein